MTESVRILIADDHELIRKGLKTVLQSHPGWVVCGEAATGREAVERARELRPAIVIMDLTMPELNGLEATRQICHSLPDTQVLILTVHHSEQLVHEVLGAGARGYLLKSDAGDAVTDAVEALSRGKSYFTPNVSDVLLASYLHPDRSGGIRTGAAQTLTPREHEIVHLIAEGKSSKEVAAILGISEATAETHRANLMRKLDVHSVSEIVRYAIRNRLIEP